MHITQLWTYPIKSCAGTPLSEATLDERGFRYDRRWMLIDIAGSPVTQREVPKLVRVEPEVTPEALLVRAPDMPPLRLPHDMLGPPRCVRLWDITMDAPSVPEAQAWFGQRKAGKFGPRLNPRSSFEAYLEEHGGRSADWTAFDLEAARELQKLLTQITTKGERAQLLRHKDLVSHQRQQDLMIAELNHRVKNILALIRSLSRQAKASSASLESYAQALEQRISALAAAHDLAVSNTMQGVSLRGILETELRPYLLDDSTQVLVSGPTVGLRADVAPMIALVFHEVVTNAAKYGALSD